MFIKIVSELASIHSLEKQEKYDSEDLDRVQEREHRAIDMNMKVQWSKILQMYLVIFTSLMFATLWGFGEEHLEPITLNFLITVGFAKVIGVVWIIVRHLFPDTK